MDEQDDYQDGPPRCGTCEREFTDAEIAAVLSLYELDACDGCRNAYLAGEDVTLRHDTRRAGRPAYVDSAGMW